MICIDYLELYNNILLLERAFSALQIFKKTNIIVILYNTCKSLKVNKFNFFFVFATSLVNIEQYLFCIGYYLYKTYDNLA